jgi:hypothetical protein
MNYGFGCGVVVDSKDRVYVTSRSTSPCVAVFDRHGKLLETWSNDFAGKPRPDNKTNPALFSRPHAMCIDSHGDFYVVEWLDFGRPRKFEHVAKA